MGNLILAVTNIVAYLPYKKAMDNHDSLTAYMILFGASASFISHLGGDYPTRILWLLLYAIDIIGFSLVVIRVIYLILTTVKTELTLRDISNLVIALLFNLLAREYGYWLYVAVHSLWHISAFFYLNILLYNKVFHSP